MKEIRWGNLSLTFGKKLPTSEVGEDINIGVGGGLWNPDDLVGAKGLATYTEMMTDPQVRACMAIKKASVLSRGWEIKAVKEDGERGLEVAAFCLDALNGMRGSVQHVLRDTCDALAKGYSVQNLVFKLATSGKWAGKWVLDCIKAKDPERWRFEVDEYYNIVSVHDVVNTKDHSPSQFVIYSYNGAYSNPYGTSDLRAAYKNYWCKQFLVKFWNIYLEKFGSPTVRGKYPRGTSKVAQAELLGNLAKIKQNTAFVIPEGFEAELLETIRQGDSGYRLAVEYHNREIAKSILNMTLITDEGSVGSFAMAKVHLDVLRMCLTELKADLEETVIFEQVLKPLVAFNFGADVPVPVFSLGPLSDKEIEPLSRVVKNLVDCGSLHASDPFIRELMGWQGTGVMPGPGKSVEIVPTVARERGVNGTNDGSVQVN